MREVKETKARKKKFRVKDGCGFSKNYKHVVGDTTFFCFVDGLFETDNAEVIAHLKTRHWCEEVK